MIHVTKLPAGDFSGNMEIFLQFLNAHILSFLLQEYD